MKDGEELIRYYKNNREGLLPYQSQGLELPEGLVQDFYEFWLEEVKKKSLSYNSYYSYKNAIQNYILPLYGRLSMGKLRKNHVKRIYKKTYDKSPSVAKILKTVLTTSFKYALCYGYVEEDYVSGLKWNRVIKKLSKSGQKKALTNSGKEIYVRGYNK